MRANRLLLAAALVVLCAACGFRRRSQAADLTGGDPVRGAVLISRYGCGSCHTIPGIDGAHGLVGPSLAGVRSRVYIAGSLENRPVSLERWIQDPHAVNPKTVMPNLGVQNQEAADIAAYIYSLQ